MNHEITELNDLTERVKAPHTWDTFNQFELAEVSFSDHQ